MSAPNPPTNPWAPVYGDDIGPTPAQRTRSAVMLVVVLVALGTVLAAAIGVAVLAMLAAVGASIG